jgi:hypothetical protein
MHIMRGIQIMKLINVHMRFKVITAVKMTWMLVFWIVTPHGHVDTYQRFGETYCLHLQDIDIINMQFSLHSCHFLYLSVAQWRFVDQSEV